MRRNRKILFNYKNKNKNKMKKKQFKKTEEEKFLKIIVGEDDEIYLYNEEFTRLEYIGLLTTLLINEIQESKNLLNKFIEKEMD